MNIKKVLSLFLILVIAFLSGCVQQQEQPPLTTVTAAETTILTTMIMAVPTTIPVASSTTAIAPQVTQTTTTTWYCTTPTMQECSDTDGGYDIYKKGNVKGRIRITQMPTDYNYYEVNESCVNETTVREYVCDYVQCYLIFKNFSVDCPMDYVCMDGACEPKNGSGNSMVATPRYGEVKAAITLDKSIYHSGERMGIDIKINSQKRIDVNLNVYGIYAGYFRLNKTQAVVLEPGANVVSFSYLSPPCNKCAGVAEGTYVISTEVLYNGDVVARDNKNVELKQ